MYFCEFDADKWQISTINAIDIKSNQNEIFKILFSGSPVSQLILYTVHVAYVNNDTWLPACYEFCYG